MAKNENLHAAKVNANDEFYTQYNDIANELGHYREHFRGKTVYCNCDDPTWSNFWRFFHNNFASLGLKKLISTHYQKDTEPSYALIYEGGDDFNMDAGRIVEIRGNYAEVNGKQVFYTAGDFRSDACIELLEEADIVSTNCPFSLFRQYLAQLIEYEKKFVILGNPNAVTYKEVFPLLKDNKIWLGVKPWSQEMYFGIPEEQKEYLIKNKKEGSAYVIRDGEVLGRVATIWLTNLDISKRHDGLWHRAGKFDQTQAHKYYEGNESKYPKYDNYDAINVDKIADIPIDYAGVMGVPITWLDKYNPEEFEIVGHPQSGIIPPGWKGVSKKLVDEYYAQGNKGAIREGWINPAYFTAEGKVVVPYQRILIRNRNPIAKKDDLGY
ncbi:MAG: adenosine deaminase [Solobacterium sp.]|nr:adenosine deaminase [Solobacterium sp.]